MTEEVKLHANIASAYVSRVEIALNLKGVRYERIVENLSNKSPELLRNNPVHKKVPVLLHNGKPISESLVIVEYIDETWKENPILPEDPYERAMARFWAKFIDEKCVPAMAKVHRSKGEEQKENLEEARALLKIFENELKGKKFFGGDNIGFVDIAACFIGFWLEVYQEVLGIKVLTKEKLPRLTEWIDDFVNCPVVKESVPPRDVLVTYIRTRLGKA